jgi:hypothetical protein
MRKTQLLIYPLDDANDVEYSFNLTADDTDDGYINGVSVTKEYKFLLCDLNYSLTSSLTPSLLILGLNQPQTKKNTLRSGQLVEVADNGVIVFQGNIDLVTYEVSPETGPIVILTLVQSIFQLTKIPFIFSSDQIKQIQKLTNLNAQLMLISDYAQKVNTEQFLNLIIDNTFYKNYWEQDKINYQDLSKDTFVLATSGVNRDEVLRSSLKCMNVVIYQNESGKIIIRGLDDKTLSPFNVDITQNSIFNDALNPKFKAGDNVALLGYKYIEHATSVPLFISNYNILSPDISNAEDAKVFILTYAPSEKYFPRVYTLKNKGWWSGIIETTQISSNIIGSAEFQAILNQINTQPDKYMKNINADVKQNNAFSYYQALLTADSLADKLKDYNHFIGKVSLDDKFLPEDISNLLGSIMNIGNCDMEHGIVATYNRHYGQDGSYLNFTLLPLGSLIGIWNNK